MIVEATQVSGMRFELRSGERILLADQRPEYGGGNTGPMPSELFLWSIASCYGQSLAHVAAKARTVLEGLRVEVTGSKDPASARISSVLVTVEARCDPDRLERIALLARNICFITNSISASVEVCFELKALP